MSGGFMSGNNRWGTKMVTKELVEQYDKRDEWINRPKPAQATAQEIKLIRDAITLPMALEIVQRVYDKTTNEQADLSQVRAMFLLKLLERIAEETGETRRELRRQSIKFTAEDIHDDVVRHSYVCRGYEGWIGITREVIRSQVGLHIRYATEAVLGIQPKGGKKP